MSERLVSTHHGDLTIHCYPLAERESDESFILRGCQNGWCWINGRAKGMHTNGGCRCIREAIEEATTRPGEGWVEQLEREFKRLLGKLYEKAEP